MRADRLLSLLLSLQNRGQSTTSKLAEELEVSQRTVIRDLYALRVAGFPIDTERGPHGGVSLHQDFRLRLTDLTRRELEALFALSVPSLLADVGMDATAKGALNKLAAALPLARSGVDHEVRNRIYMDPEPWSEERNANPLLTVLRQAVWEDAWCRITFERIHHIPMENEAAVFGLVAKAGRWYIIWADRDGAMHVDRGSCVLDATHLDETFERPPEFDLVRFWKTWEPQYESARPRFSVQIRIRLHSMEGIKRRLAGHSIQIDATKAGQQWIPARLEFDSFEHARATLLSCGGAVIIDEPRALKLSVCDFAERTIEANTQQTTGL